MNEIVSLLDQCLLYTDPKHNPFKTHCLAAEVNPAESTHLSPKSRSLAAVVKSQLDVDQTSECLKSSVETSRLLSYSFDFKLPIPEDQLITQPITPIARSTSRRKESRLHAKQQHGHLSRYVVHQSSVRTKTRSESKVVSSPEGTACTVSTIVLNFLHFPGEVRNLIYCCLFKDARLYINQKPYCRHAYDLDLAIRMACKTTHSETSRALFGCLTVHLIDSLAWCRPGAIPLRVSIPSHIFDKLESLVILIPQGVPTVNSIANVQDIISLRRLKLIDVRVKPAAATADSDNAETQRARSIFKHPEDHSSHWVSGLIARPQRTFSVEYEQEIWSKFNENRAPCMGSLKRTCYHTEIIACSELNHQLQVSRRKLEVDELERRYQIYKRMKKDGWFLDHGSHESEILQRLVDMRYHSNLDKIEFGIAEVAAKAKKTSLPDMADFKSPIPLESLLQPRA